jgi:hypothetical protein
MRKQLVSDAEQRKDKLPAELLGWEEGGAVCEDSPTDVFSRVHRAAETAIMAGREGYDLHVFASHLAQVKNTLPAALKSAPEELRPLLRWLSERL